MTFQAENELDLTQKIINAQEDFCFRIFSWALGLVTALTIGSAHESIDISRPLYLISGLFIVVVLCSVARCHWLTLKNAMSRSFEIETEVQKDIYSGPKVNESLKKTCVERLSVSKRFFGPYIVLFFIVIASSIFK